MVESQSSIVDRKSGLTLQAGGFRVLAMKKLSSIPAIVVAAALGILISGCHPADQSAETAAVAGKPYPLDTCLVCGMKLSDMSEVYTFTYQGQQIKLCSKSERVDFDKDPAKYMKQIAAAEAQSGQ
jgi:YHS domain-containing protein